MISNEISLSHDEKIASFTQTTLLSIRKIFNNHVQPRFLQQSTEYPGSALSRQEIKSILVQKSYSVAGLKRVLQMRNNKPDNMSNNAFTSIKWMLTAMSGLLTTALIIFLES